MWPSVHARPSPSALHWRVVNHPPTEAVFMHVTVIHFYFGANLVSVFLVQEFFTETKSLPKFSSGLPDAAACSKWSGSPLALSKFSPYRNGEFSLYRKLYATEIKGELQYTSWSASVLLLFSLASQMFCGIFEIALCIAVLDGQCIV